MIGSGEIAIRLVLSVLLSSLIGLERELKQHGAGFRTHILVCLGSALIMLTSLYVFDIYKDVVNLDPARIASGIITGIGFLCAGTIMRYGGTVKGLTTAASLWVTAGVGMAVGCGFYWAAAITTFIVFVVLFFFGGLEKKVKEKITKGGQDGV
ncbi:MAG: MgtC/SapB family protein [Candidatus Omnitrophica bacterium]|nr:MgtC/SapB family protein [Candidatus Omnitrophota bacterium]